ncbi:AMP-binding enzyme [Roseobacter sinensis]|uniref:AMP-binding enzyme C-terminal domain-containing protein n=1 Tax=Roseobacter sinensis TaxID=2931391 RepID=A0ABT3BIP1_9RHOB|nr:hypothetical protein [Roseobacter sp. WL0113]MCV3273433.1 hypothetical protein [Roseobacter sp. WL0113]
MLKERHPAVATACCFATPDKVTGEAVAAAVILKPDVKTSDAHLLVWVKSQILAEAQT